MLITISLDKLATLSHVQPNILDWTGVCFIRSKQASLRLVLDPISYQRHLKNRAS